MKALRCAIYTRKSTEEGLEQGFNSLHAQREACEAYVLSQAGEGWQALPREYDDGGYSGGSMERPGLKQLMADIAKGEIDIVVVYKVDRRTRSLPARSARVRATRRMRSTARVLRTPAACERRSGPRAHSSTACGPRRRTPPGTWALTDQAHPRHRSACRCRAAATRSATTAELSGSAAPAAQDVPGSISTCRSIRSRTGPERRLA